MTQQIKKQQRPHDKYSQRPGENLLDWHIRIEDFLQTVAIKLYGYALEKPLREQEIREVCIESADDLMYLATNCKQVRLKHPHSPDYKNVTKRALEQVREDVS